ncbi:MAG TPA: HEAT repeat domain-containing protein [Proteobacteria bacterium]|nr:phycocyanobilin lyase subunit beta [bacterium BMS3Abin14]HDL53663.1 HEAT repeat domain-containing protein [Pseudomonadota bacterium]
MRNLILALIAAIMVACSTAHESIDTLALNAAHGDGGAADRLVLAMGDRDRERSLDAYRSVVSMGDPMIPFLYGGLGSDDQDLFEACAAALGSIGSTDSLPELKAALDRKGMRRYAVAWALGEIGDLSVVPLLLRSLATDDVVLRKTAVRALVRLGPSVGPRVLRVLLERSDDVKARRAAIRVLGEIRESAAVPLLTEVEGVNLDAAVWALGRIGDPRALQPLLEDLSDDTWSVRRQAAQALGNLEDAGAVPALRLTLDDPEPVVREWAARSLETLTGKQVLYRNEDGRMVQPYNLYH